MGEITAIETKSEASLKTLLNKLSDITTPNETGYTISVKTLEQWNLDNSVSGKNHTGACGFPFGLDSFYTFSDEGNGKYIYTVTEPYCD